MADTLLPMFPGLGPLGPSGIALGLALAATVGVVVATAWPGLVVRRSGLVLALFATATLMALDGLVDFETGELNLQIDPSTEALLPMGDPQTSELVPHTLLFEYRSLSATMCYAAKAIRKRHATRRLIVYMSHYRFSNYTQTMY